ncbi:MAG TPA: hypothetical protein VES20_14295 [Bryobacteraceae bacterium]|nr:hypothetical protein [Bryobacteraceae bacterium]
MAANDGVKRGDSERTGDLEARVGHEFTPDELSAEGTDVDFDMGEIEGIDAGASGDLEDLTIVQADDPSLGLTNIGDQGPDDWAADTGPTRNPDRGLSTERLRDDASTLGPDK